MEKHWIPFYLFIYFVDLKGSQIKSRNSESIRFGLKILKSALKSVITADCDIPLKSSYFEIQMSSAALQVTLLVRTSNKAADLWIYKMY